MDLLPTRYVKFRVVHAPGMPGTFSPPPRDNDPDMHHGTCVAHVPWCISGSLTGFLWSRWRGKRSRHYRCMRNPQFYVPGKRPTVRVVIRFYSVSQPVKSLVKNHIILRPFLSWMVYCGNGGQLHCGVSVIGLLTHFGPGTPYRKIDLCQHWLNVAWRYQTISRLPEPMLNSQ